MLLQQLLLLLLLLLFLLLLLLLLRLQTDGHLWHLSVLLLPAGHLFLQELLLLDFLPLLDGKGLSVRYFLDAGLLSGVELELFPVLTGGFLLDQRLLLQELLELFDVLVARSCLHRLLNKLPFLLLLEGVLVAKH